MRQGHLGVDRADQDVMLLPEREHGPAQPVQLLHQVGDLAAGERLGPGELLGQMGEDLGGPRLLQQPLDPGAAVRHPQRVHDLERVGQASGPSFLQCTAQGLQLAGRLTRHLDDRRLRGRDPVVGVERDPQAADVHAARVA